MFREVMYDLCLVVLIWMSNGLLPFDVHGRKCIKGLFLRCVCVCLRLWLRVCVRVCVCGGP